MSFTFSIPELETERLVLRAPSAKDAEAHAAFYGSQRAKYVGGPLQADMAWRVLMLEMGHWLMRGFGRWILTEKGANDAIGIVGLFHFKEFDEPEIGWDLYEGATGKGYAIEAAQVVRKYAYGTMGWRTITSVIHSENAGSIAVAQRLGARYEKDVPHGQFGSVQLWRHPGPEDLE